MQGNGNVRAALSTTDVIEVRIGDFLFPVVLLCLNQCQNLEHQILKLSNNLRSMLVDYNEYGQNLTQQVTARNRMCVSQE